MAYSVTINSSGISAPTYAEIFAGLQSEYKAIYGADVYLEPDSQDGQFLALIALAIHNENNAIINTYNSFSPSFAIGAHLSSLVKINGLKRKQATFSTVVARIIGQAGTIINNGIVADNQNLGNQWSLPALVTIPLSGQIDVTATALNAGSITASINTITSIITPVPGWQTVTNPSAATVGNPVETDAELRRRQSVSTSLPATTVVESIYGAVANVTGVQRLALYENSGQADDENGIPGHSIAIVVEGGDVNEIAEAIFQRKTPGSTTYGTTTVEVEDQNGLITSIHFFVLSLVTITIEIDLLPLQGYISTTGDTIKQQLVDFLTDLPVGFDSYLSKLQSAAQIDGELGLTYNIQAIRQSRSGPPLVQDVEIEFNEATTATINAITINLV